jgi:Uma2 family endonuclease
MSTVPNFQPRYTVADYRQWEGKWELWNGYPVAMSASVFGAYSFIASQITTALNIAANHADCDASVLPELDWVVAEDTVVRPDISVVCGQFPPKHVESAPAMVVEVLSDSTRDQDLNYKRELYEQNQVRWYLIFDPKPQTITALKLNAEGKFETVPDVSDSLEVSICGDCDLTINLQRVFQ